MPPPIVVLLAEHYVCGDDGDFDDCDDTHETDDAEETKNIVIATFVLPQTSEDKKKFDKYYRERDEACNQDAVNTSGIPRLLGDLPRNWAGLCGMLIRLALVEAIQTSGVDKRKLNQK